MNEVSISEIRKISETLEMFNESIKEIDLMTEKKADQAGDWKLSEPKVSEDALAHDPDLDGDDSECGPADQSDLIDEALEGVISTLTEAGYDDDSAESATFDALEFLIDDGILTDTPDMDDAVESKNKWVSNSVPKIVEKLKEMGLDF